MDARAAAAARGEGCCCLPSASLMRSATGMRGCSAPLCTTSSLQHQPTHTYLTVSHTHDLKISIYIGEHDTSVMQALCRGSHVYILCVPHTAHAMGTADALASADTMDHWLDAACVTGRSGMALCDTLADAEALMAMYRSDWVPTAIAKLVAPHQGNSCCANMVLHDPASWPIWASTQPHRHL